MLLCEPMICRSCAAPLPPSPWRLCAHTPACHRCAGLAAEPEAALEPVPNAREFTQAWDRAFQGLPHPVQVRIILNPRGQDAIALGSQILRGLSQPRADDAPQHPPASLPVPAGERRPPSTLDEEDAA